MKFNSRTLVAIFTILAFLLASCGGSAADDATATSDETGATDTTADSNSDSSAGIGIVSAAEVAAILENPPEDLVILDVRTPEEFDSGFIDGAIMIDFYESDFADQIASLDPDVPYLIYCNSGNRSGQTTILMNELGFGNVADVDGGIQAWNASGLPTVTP